MNNDSKSHNLTLADIINRTLEGALNWQIVRDDPDAFQKGSLLACAFPNAYAFFDIASGELSYAELSRSREFRMPAPDDVVELLIGVFDSQQPKLMAV